MYGAVSARKRFIPESVKFQMHKFYNNAKEKKEDKHIMVKYTLSFYQNIWQYTTLHKLGIEYKWKDK